MSEEGNHYESYIKDEARFSIDSDYKQVWIGGENEGKKLPDEAVSIGKIIGGTYSGVQVSKEAKKNREFDKTAKDAVKSVDTTGMKRLGNWKLLL